MLPAQVHCTDAEMVHSSRTSSSTCQSDLPQPTALVLRKRIHVEGIGSALWWRNPLLFQGIAARERALSTRRADVALAEEQLVR